MLPTTAAQMFSSVHRKRWGPVAWCIMDMLELEQPLRYGWDKERYRGDGRGREDPDNNHSVSMDEVDAAISSPGWWATLKLLDKLNSVIRDAITWSESCSCHSDNDRERATATSAELKLWDSCPLRGRRNHEVAGGDVSRCCKYGCPNILPHFYWICCKIRLWGLMFGRGSWQSWREGELILCSISH